MPTRAAMKPLSPSPCTVGGSRSTEERTPREARASVICAVARRVRGPAGRCAGAEPGSLPSRREPERSGGDDERPARTCEHLAERLDGAAVGVGSTLEIPGEGEVVLE